MIELLVVISVITPLMAVLMPALNRAREVVCRSPLPQGSLCFTMYTGDHDGKFVPGIDEDWPRWMRNL
ncbi:MAG: hypothetical protein A2Y77_14805 [Planctomycetes bacterium RBG_13_62_9]|nr:MAG: hypothetical protein A2Y77_14805 [Planctomycetes bacterium RBG_13_62_9]